MSPVKIPAYAKILVIGGGPSGSYAATVLQREGHQVVLLEAAKFPRYHIGESMLPSMRNYLRFIDFEEAFVKHGFLIKPGACFKLVKGLRDTYTDFLALGRDHSTFNVIRSEMDDLLLRHAEESGVQVFEETRVESIDFEGDPATSRPVAAHWRTKRGETGVSTFDWLIDASGRAGIMSTKYLDNRVMRESLRNVAVWGYWKDVQKKHVGTERENAPWFEALTEETGWAWTIPLHDGTTSIGVVAHKDVSNAKKSQVKDDGEKLTLEEHYLDQLQYLPGVKELIADKGQLIPNSTRNASDYSYFTSRCSGDHFRTVGDAANFVDPFFSSGVHIAMTGALSAALTICSSNKGEVTEEFAQQWHDEKVGMAHTRFLFVVLSAYQQMHLQKNFILTNVNEDNFDSAFDMFRPVIYGLADSSAKLTDAKVQSMMDFFQSCLDPNVDTENMRAVRKRYGADLVSIESPVLGPQRIETLTGSDKEGERVMKKLDALKVFNDDNDPMNMARHPLLGYAAHMEKGQLGLRPISSLRP
ncbi:FAD/NAD(P)-binding domain-containing protein [Laetiporus sulphureus 93-53]|uniref:FAD/NAD(P)-binding domain-containing protein n=1 Tax=Laetiporus sulphureus 93-53 TaxID=1314785 RepID=A0A165DWE4_9APHY|nr:FAD/NAD(P)-binding domain-containing protein [Laetiporus sulphureus 93-53]KZT05768.1 FAD/NAD(P)-binding domain-containing protein [Laetiporus sulphureus 93-53]